MNWVVVTNAAQPDVWERGKNPKVNCDGRGMNE